MHNASDIRDVYVCVIDTGHYVLKIRTHFVHMSIYHEVTLPSCIRIQRTELNHHKLSKNSAL